MFFASYPYAMRQYISAYSLFDLLNMDFNTIFHLGIHVLLIFVLFQVWKKTFRRHLDPRIPVIKVPRWSIFGTARIFHSLRSLCKQTKLSINVYILQVATGFRFYFQKEDIFCLWMAFHPFLILNKAPAVEELLSSKIIVDKGWSNKMLGPMLGNGLLTSPASIWRKRRKLLNNSFHFDLLKDFQIIFDKEAKVLVDILKGHCENDWVDIHHYLTLCTLDIIFESALGVKIGAQMNKSPEFVQCILRAEKAVMERIISPQYWIDSIYRFLPAGRKFYKDVKFFLEYMRKILKEKKSEKILDKKLRQNETAEKVKTTSSSIQKRKVLMDFLLDIHLSNQEELTEEDVMDEIKTFTLAGHGTTSSGLLWTLYLLGLHPDIQDKVHEELDQIFGDNIEREVTMDDLKRMDYFECVFKESLRLYPPVPIIAREIQEEGEFYGYHLNKGTTLAVILYALHRDPDNFPNPEKFDPSRFFPENCVGRHPYAFVPFALGIRNCIGQRFAILEAKTIAAHILRNFEVRSLEPRDRVFPSAEIALKSFYPVKIKFTKRVL